jgi:hypothetical protein
MHSFLGVVFGFGAATAGCCGIPSPQACGGSAVHQIYAKSPCGIIGF